MGFLDRLLGRDPAPRPTAPPAAPQVGPPRSADEQAVERYRYLLRTAPPDQVEAAHAEAFAKLTPEQRQQVLTQLGDAVPPGERPTSDDPQQLARAATRAEVRQPGTLERSFGGGGMGGRGGPGFGSMVGASLLGTVAGVVVGTAVADALFDTGMGDGGLFGGGDEEAYAQGYEDGAGGDPGADAGGDFGGGDFGDFGGGGDF
ncbi:hypothetical protein [Klenkia taihuensis]|uniref:DUF2076 domain-containing protein n=1 Tax=Klenkia taihuensis TaxID=1225127 RepID=A0A1I1H5P1_9ACTN|nr:hypothetical protein [Klenkia taihuensis]GHE09470.1 hypothetical protein GCM10011381_14530 [Klenkia taihuensis]SFC16753.1 hypothetical protein SAMN05661030_0282 [Klenkia taihuensis]